MFVINAKKVLAFVFIVLTLTFAIGCTEEQSVPNGSVYEVEFLNYYKSSKHFLNIEPLLKQYFESVQKAYNESDKSDLKTFNIEAAGQVAADGLISYFNVTESSDETPEQRLVFLDLYEPFSEVNVVVAEIEVSVAATDNKSLNQPDKLIELKKTVNDALKKYSGYDSLENKTSNFITDEGEARYKIIRSDGCIESADAARELWKSLNEKGVSCRNQTDIEKDTDFEILIGNTNRSESKTAFDKLKNENGRWIVCSIGRKIVIYAVDPTDLKTAVEYYINNRFSMEAQVPFEEYISK